MRHYVISADGEATTEQRDSFTQWIRSQPGVNWWHWLSHFWLVVDYDDQYVPQTLSTELRRHVPEGNSIVLRVNPHRNWAAWMPVPLSDADPDFAVWLNTVWWTGEPGTIRAPDPPAPADESG